MKNVIIGWKRAILVGLLIFPFLVHLLVRIEVGRRTKIQFPLTAIFICKTYYIDPRSDYLVILPFQIGKKEFKLRSLFSEKKDMYFKSKYFDIPYREFSNAEQIEVRANRNPDWEVHSKKNSWIIHCRMFQDI